MGCRTKCTVCTGLRSLHIHPLARPGPPKRGLYHAVRKRTGLSVARPQLDIAPELQRRTVPGVRREVQYRAQVPPALAFLPSSRWNRLVLSPDHCPADPEETAKAYLLFNLPADEARAFEDHFIACPRCAAILEETDRYVLATKQAAQRLRRSGK
jgi:hypothetical protein